MCAAWLCAAVTPLLFPHVPTMQKTRSSTRKSVPPSYKRLAPKSLDSGHASSKNGWPRVREDRWRNRREQKRNKRSKPNHIAEACLCPTADSLQELKQRFTSTTGLDEEEFGFSSQTQAIGPIEIVHNLFYWNGFSIRSINASGKLIMARLQEENPRASNAEGEAGYEGAHFQSGPL